MHIVYMGEKVHDLLSHHAKHLHLQTLGAALGVYVHSTLQMSVPSSPFKCASQLLEVPRLDVKSFKRFLAN